MCMGGGGDDVETKRHHEIEKLIRQDEKRMTKEVQTASFRRRIESGKSTILKQMKLITHLDSPRAIGWEDYKVIIFANLLDSIKITLEAMEQFDITLDNPQNELAVDLIVLDRELSRGEPFPKEYEQPFRRLWSDKGVQQAINRGNDFFDNLDRLFSQGYLPSDQDILRSRLKTTGITETVFDPDRESERKKWIHCFEGVTALLFLVAISGYDQCLVEDKDANQMQEALMLFESICNSQWFVKTSINLQKIETSPVNKTFKQASGFFQENFKRL
ncbi:G-protein alpha subunit-domain-containing protein [Pyronema omphalodes]|nr:G-protein alpha subunit-domain-containing protein [Pyronema omphalodes]